MARFMAERGRADYAALWRWSVDDLEGFWAAIWERFEAGGPFGRVLADASMPGAEWFPGARLNYAERLFRGKPGDRVAILHASELRAARALDLGGAARADRPHPRRPAGPRRRARRPRRRLPAQRARDDRRVPRDRLAGRRVVVRGARVRRPQRVRPLRPDRAEGAARDRRLPLRRARLRPPRRGRRDRRRDRRAGRAARLPRRQRLGGRLPRRAPSWSSSRCRSTTRCGCSTRPAPPACRRRSCRGRAGSCSST